MDPSARRLGVIAQHMLDPQITPRQPQPQPPAAAVPAGVAPIVIVGSMVMDLQAYPEGGADVRRGGSVPGRVETSPGGVARNVGEALARLTRGGDGATSCALPLLVSVVGADSHADALLRQWEALGCSTAGVTRVAGARTPVVAVVFSRAGDVAASVADVGLVEAQLTPRLLQRHVPQLAAAPLVVLDGNLTADSIVEACRLARGDVWFEPVSAPKSMRCLAALPRIAYASPNREELLAMAAAALEARPELAAPAGSGAAVPGGREPPAALRELRSPLGVLLRAGVGIIVLTLGDAGAAWCRLSADRRHIDAVLVPALPAEVANTSGAGDCLVAGCLHALSSGERGAAALARGVAAATLAVQSPRSVPERLAWADVRRLEREAARRAAAFRWPAA